MILAWNILLRLDRIPQMFDLKKDFLDGFSIQIQIFKPIHEYYWLNGKFG